MLRGSLASFICICSDIRLARTINIIIMMPITITSTTMTTTIIAMTIAIVPS